MTQNIAVIAANGKSGQLIVREAVDRGLDAVSYTHLTLPTT